MEKHDEFLVTAGAIFTGRGLVPDMALLVREGRIAETGPILPDERKLRVFHFPGCTVAPVFCDHHLHVPTGSPAKARRAIDKLLACGISAAWDGGGQHASAREVKKVVGAEFALRTAGRALYREGTYGMHIGEGVMSPSDGEELIDRLAAEGADYIKIINSGILIPDTGEISSGGFPLSGLTRMIEHARSWGLQVACHANGDKAIQDAVRAGADIIVHGLGITIPVIDMMAERGAALIPTIYAFQSLQAKYPSAEARSTIARAIEQHCAAVKNADVRGVRVLAGSDAGPSFIPFGTSLWAELDLLKRSGLSPQAVLSAAAAGSLEQHEPATFLVFQGSELKALCLNGIWVKGDRHE